MTKNVTLSESQMKAIQLLMRSLPVAEVARDTGVTRTTIYRWLKDEIFNAELDKRKNELIRQASRKLAGALNQSVDKLIWLSENCKQKNVQRLALCNVIEYCQKFSDSTDIEKRIKALEETIK